MIGVLVLSQRKNAMNSRLYGPASHGNRGDLHLQTYGVTHSPEIRWMDLVLGEEEALEDQSVLMYCIAV